MGKGWGPIAKAVSEDCLRKRERAPIWEANIYRTRALE